MWVEKDGKILLVRRAIKPALGLWTVPGGFVNAWEDPAKAAARECSEETGFVIFYRGQVTSGEMKAGDDADAVGWFGPDELPNIAFEATGVMIARWHLGDLD